MARYILPSYSLILMAALMIVVAEAHDAVSPATPVRKIGKHRGKAVISPAVSPSSSPSEGLHSEEVLGAHAPEFEHSEDGGHLPHLHHRRAVDRSVAAGGVILGGLGTAFFVAVACYIRATRRRSPVGEETVESEPATPAHKV